MESLGPLMRKFDFPSSVLEALKIVHLQCEKMSLNPTSTLSQELSQVTDFVDEFIFGNAKSKQKSKKLNCIEQLQVIEAIIEHFDGEAEFSLLCSVFMVVFLAKGKNIDFKMDTLSKMLCLNLSQGHRVLLNCAALWLSQQPLGANHCKQIAKSIVQDYLVLLPENKQDKASSSRLVETPLKSPLLAGILLTHFCDLYKLSDSVGVGTSSLFKAPPIQLVRLSTRWLMDQKDLCGAHGNTECQNVVAMLGVSPIPGLLAWSILGPLVNLKESQDQELEYSELHLAVLMHITLHNSDSSLPAAKGGSSSYLSNLTEHLMAVLDTNGGSNNGSSDEPSPIVSKALDRYGQALQAALSAGVQVDQDLLLLIDQLPYNRLINIVTSNIG